MMIILVIWRRRRNEAERPPVFGPPRGFGVKAHSVNTAVRFRARALPVPAAPPRARGVTFARARPGTRGRVVSVSVSRSRSRLASPRGDSWRNGG
eukprot:1437157-Prymnesium_polylepis.1